MGLWLFVCLIFCLCVCLWKKKKLFFFHSLSFFSRLLAFNFEIMISLHSLFFLSSFKKWSLDWKQLFNFVDNNSQILNWRKPKIYTLQLTVVQNLMKLTKVIIRASFFLLDVWKVNVLFRFVLCCMNWCLFECGAKWTSQSSVI